VRCTSCRQVRVAGAGPADRRQAYDGDEYFTVRNRYVERRSELSDHFSGLVGKIREFTQGGALLDVGCGVGIFLEVAAASGFDVQGVEVSTWASEFARARGLQVSTGTLREAAYPAESFDVVTVNHVLEHLPDPLATLAEVRRVLRGGGLLVIGVPNFGSFAAILRRGRWRSLLPDQHLWQFTRGSLRNLLESAGFGPVYFEARDNHPVRWSKPTGALLGVLLPLAVLLDRSEAMLVFARKARPENQRGLIGAITAEAGG
jgi:SAM-dependent methyltransferase